MRGGSLALVGNRGDLRLGLRIKIAPALLEKLKSLLINFIIISL